MSTEDPISCRHTRHKTVASVTGRASQGVTDEDGQRDLTHRCIHQRPSSSTTPSCPIKDQHQRHRLKRLLCLHRRAALASRGGWRWCRQQPSQPKVARSCAGDALEGEELLLERQDGGVPPTDGLDPLVVPGRGTRGGKCVLDAKFFFGALRAETVDLQDGRTFGRITRSAISERVRDGEEARFVNEAADSQS